MTRLARTDALVTLAALVCIVAWDLAAGDLWVSRHFAGADGFEWRNAWLLRDVLHDGGRWLAGVVLLALVVDAVRPHAQGPSRAERWQAIGAVLLGLTVVPLLKRASRTSCPWDLAEFGGEATRVSHWLWGVADGGPGHCFPSGHAVAAFAFFALYFLWRPYRPGWARVWLWATVVAGVFFGAAQVLRGAHFVSHVLWSAWVCWTLAAGVSAGLSLLRIPARHRAAAADSLA